jgi:hypothetical protein
MAPGEYPSLFTSNGARHKHVDCECEWLGYGIDSEGDARLVNLDNPFDDGVSIGAIVPGDEVPVDIHVNTNQTLADDPLNPRYVAAFAWQNLYVNGWADWDADGIWTPAEHVIFWQGVPVVPSIPTPSATIAASPTFVFPELPVGPFAEDLDLHFMVPVPLHANLDLFYWRFRLDWGEDVGRAGNPISDPGLWLEVGEAQFGEVEDHESSPGIIANIGQGDAEDRPLLPKTFALESTHPNPFNPNSQIQFGVPAPGGEVEIAIYNIRGERVKVLTTGVRAPGWYTEIWSGRDDQERDVASGVYFVRMTAGEFMAQKSITLLR